MPEFTSNREAFHNYAITEKFEAGIVLSGAEVKSVKHGNVSLKGSYATIRGSELWLLNSHIGSYKPAGLQQKYDPARTRKLLVRRGELSRLIGKLKSEGLSLVPFSFYIKQGLIKVVLGLGLGKKAHDKRSSIKQREVKRKIARAMRVKE